ncbi:MAG: hypothetical protein H0V88_15620 [Pyrinomonadaceae bacterium]|nr:hypothetical protein [Pyrinomonadaceae bacterium]
MLTSYGFRRLAIQNSKLQFVVWTLSSLYALAVTSLRLPYSRKAWFGITISLSLI